MVEMDHPDTIANNNDKGKNNTLSFPQAYNVQSCNLNAKPYVAVEFP